MDNSTVRVVNFPLMRASIIASTIFVGSNACAHSSVTTSKTGATFESWLIGLMLISAILYLWGANKLWRRASASRRLLQQRGSLFIGGLIVLTATVLSPLHAAGARSFTLHMLEHEIIMLLAAPLLALARPLVIMLWALPTAARLWLANVTNKSGTRRCWYFITRPVTATLLQIAMLWLWHMPALFERALHSEAWHTAQHLSFLISALLFWWALTSARGRARDAVAALYLFITAVVSGFLGALMALSVSPWYSRYAAMGMAPFGLSPIEDQQMAGLLMWLGGGLVHVGIALVLLWRWLQRAPLTGGGNAIVVR